MTIAIIAAKNGRPTHFLCPCGAEWVGVTPETETEVLEAIRRHTCDPESKAR